MRFSDDSIAMMQMAKEGLIEARKATFGQPGTDPTIGWQAYDLEQPAKELIPVYTPLLREIPRSGGGFANRANWKTVTGLNTGNLTSGVPEASRNGQINYTLSEYNASFKTLYMEGSATLQGRLAAQQWDDPDARATRYATTAHYIENEWIILGGNTTSTGIALGSCTGLAMASSATGGTLGAATYFATVVPLSLDGWRQTQQGAPAGTGNGQAFGVGQNVAADVGGVRTITPVFGSSFAVNLGCGSVAANVNTGALTGSTNQFTLSWAPKQGAVAYAVYAGTATGAMKYQGVSYTTSFTVGVTIVPAAGGSATLVTGTQDSSAITADRSQNQYVYDGIITQILRTDPNTSATAGYYKSIGGTLTATGKGGIVEFDNFFVDRMKLYRISKFDIWVGIDQVKNITAKVTAGSTATPYMIQVAPGSVNLIGGQRVTGYNHPITGEALDVRYHPNIPAGLVVFKIKELSPEYYRNDNIPAPWRIKEWLSYTSIHWPENTFQRDVGVVTAEVLQGYVPFGNGLLSEIVLG